MWIRVVVVVVCVVGAWCAWVRGGGGPSPQGPLTSRSRDEKPESDSQYSALRVTCHYLQASSITLALDNPRGVERTRRGGSVRPVFFRLQAVPVRVRIAVR